MYENNKEYKLTAKQEAYCINRVIEKMSQKNAYLKSFGRGNKTDKSTTELASRLEKRSNIQSRMRELKDSILDKIIWPKVDMINDLKEIAIECKKEQFSSRNRAVAVNAIKTASDMLGYTSAQKLEVTDNTPREMVIKVVDASIGCPISADDVIT